MDGAVPMDEPGFSSLGGRICGICGVHKKAKAGPVE
jgi:hypothetical protein